MRRIAIVGAGQAGLVAAHALLQRGYQVTVHSDKSPEDFLERSRPTGAAARFEMAVAFERELGLEHWGHQAPRCEGVHLTFCPRRDNQLLTLLGRLTKGHLMAIDLRLQSATWLEQLAERGGGVEIESVDVRRLDEIAARNDLTIVAAGRGELTKLFPRDQARSVYRSPQRQLAMICVRDVPIGVPYAPWFLPIKFNFLGPYGEAFWMPWYSKDGDHATVLVVEARAGSPLDRFRDCASAEQVLARAQAAIRELTPWDRESFEHARICDENAWLVGAITPEIRHVVGTLPSGRHVMALGDTAQSLDPIAGQGANSGNKMAQVYAVAVAERGDLPFDADWMRATFERFWARHGDCDRLTSTLLEPLSPAGGMLLTAQYGSTGCPDDDSPQQRIANAFIDNFNDPIELTDALHDVGRAKQVISDAFGSATRPLVWGRLRLARGQLRQRLGRPAGHPGS